MLFLEQTALQCSRESIHLIVDYLSFVKKIILLCAMRFTQSKGREVFCYSVPLKHNGNNYGLSFILIFFLSDSMPLKFCLGLY